MRFHGALLLLVEQGVTAPLWNLGATHACELVEGLITDNSVVLTHRGLGALGNFIEDHYAVHGLPCEAMHMLAA